LVAVSAVEVVVLDGGAAVLVAGAAVGVDAELEAARVVDDEPVDPPHDASSSATARTTETRDPICVRLSVSADMNTTKTPPQPRNDMVGKLDRHVPFWGPQFVVLGAILLDLSLPQRVTIGPFWLLPSLEGVLLLGLMIASPNPRVRHSPLRRRIAIGLIGLISATNIVSLVLLCRELLHGAVKNGRPLILGGIVLWVTNVLLFGLWYWELDRGGPLERRYGTQEPPDFLFPQMSEPRWAPEGWMPGLVDYLYVSFTNATAFSPTDTMPLTATAKWLMTAQSLTALVTLGLVIARAVNILPSG
jgi:hypothetical protein